MRRALLFLSFFYLYHTSWGQKQFVQTNNNNFFGQAIRVAPTTDQGYIIFSADSLKMIRFDRCSQPVFSNKYILPFDPSVPAGIASLPDNSCVILTQSTTQSGTCAVLTKIDSTGNISWCRSFSNPFVSESICSINTDEDGNIMVVTKADSAGETSNVIFRVNTQGVNMYDISVDNGGVSGSCILTADGGMLLNSGNRFIKTDQFGNLKWAVTAGSSNSYFSKPVEVGNGYLFTGNVTVAGDITIMKLGLNGNLIAQKRTDFFGLAPELKIRPDRKLMGLFMRTNANRDYSTVVNFDSSLNILSQNSNCFYNFFTSLHAQDLAVGTDGAPVFGGITNPAGSLFFGRSDGDFNTGCDTSLGAVLIAPGNASQSNATVQLRPYSHTITDLVASKESFTDSQIVLCSVPAEIAIGGDTLICSERPATLYNIATDYFDNFIWSSGESSRFIMVTQPGKYWMEGIGRCSLDTLVDTIDIVRHDLVPFDLGDDKYKCSDRTLVLDGPGCDHCSYLWNDGSMGQSMTVKSYGKQWLKVTNDGCVTIDSVDVVNAKCECHFYVPNTITPNHDGINDLFKPKYYCDLKDYSLRIFNRWGELLFSTEDIEQAWDAKYHNIPVPEGVYIYVASFTSLMEGEEADKAVHTGTVGVVY